MDECIIGFHRVIRLFQCPGKGKACFLRGFFTLIGQKKGLGGLVADGRPNEKCSESRKALEDRMKNAVRMTAEEIEKYVRAVESDEPLSIRLNRDFE